MPASLPLQDDLYAALLASGAAPGHLEALLAASPEAVRQRLAGVDPELLRAVLRAGRGEEAIPGAARIVQHLRHMNPVPMFDPAPSLANSQVLRADGSTPEMPEYSDRAFDAWFTAIGATYGLGPRGERRRCYETDQFADSASPERRTIHMGIDVFAPAGTPVFAPIAGTVQRIVYNADPLDYGHTLFLRHDTEAGRFYTLYGHLAGTLPGLLQEGAPVSPGQHIADLGDWHENGGWGPHLHFQIMTSLLSQRDNFFGVAHPSLWQPVWQVICPDPDLLMRLPEGSFAR